MTTAEICNVIAKANHKFHDLSDDKDLARENLSLSDYREVERLLPNLGAPGTGERTLYKNAADWFERNGYTVYEHSIIGYVIEI